MKDYKNYIYQLSIYLQYRNIKGGAPIPTDEYKLKTFLDKFGDKGEFSFINSGGNAQVFKAHDKENHVFALRRAGILDNAFKFYMALKTHLVDTGICNCIAKIYAIYILTRDSEKKYTNTLTEWSQYKGNIRIDQMQLMDGTFDKIGSDYNKADIFFEVDYFSYTIKKYMNSLIIDDKGRNHGYVNEKFWKKYILNDSDETINKTKTIWIHPGKHFYRIDFDMNLNEEVGIHITKNINDIESLINVNAQKYNQDTLFEILEESGVKFVPFIPNGDEVIGNISYDGLDVKKNALKWKTSHFTLEFDSKKK
jgi:hypothetical protein